ncbi:MAG: dihydrofolate reductase [Proteobacteria bacterium]|nr:dihydrofolate reductase [Pseudomonadota bacterium]
MEPFDLKTGRHLVMIAAIDEAGGIGRDGRIPWDCPEDRAFFKAQTMGYPIVVGRRTFESWGGRPLPGRPCGVWTRHPEQFDRHCFDWPFFASADDAALVEWGFAQSDIVYVCGGKTLYELLWSKLTDLIITQIPGDYDCDVRLDLYDGGFACVGRAQGKSCTFSHFALAFAQ